LNDLQQVVPLPDITYNVTRQFFLTSTSYVLSFP
jgi:hypothetical protein